jgi:apolipoprotein N-acyltransferase
VRNFLDPALHGGIDYALALAFLFAPGVLGFPNAAANASQLIGLAYLGLSLATHYPLGAFKLVAFPAHGVIESAMALTWLGIPWIVGFDDHAPARIFFVAAGGGLLAVVAATDYRATRRVRARSERRRPGIDRRERSLAVRFDRRLGDRRAYF